MTASSLPEFVVDRVFDAPREMVWRAWTDPEVLVRWYGPNVETIVHQFDLEPGGLWLGEMRWGGNSHFSRIVFQEVVAEQKLVWHHASSDSDWNVIANPMMPGWPKVLLTTVVFEPEGDKTKVRLTVAPIDGSVEEVACFAESMAGLGRGWGSGFEILDEVLAELSSLAAG